MSSIKVVDVNNEEVKQEEPTEQIEEAKEEINEVVEETPIEQETKTEEVKEEIKQETKPVAQRASAGGQSPPPVKAQDKLVRCPKCFKEMKLKSLRYGHEQKCQGTLEQKPVKPFSKPRATPKPKIQPVIRQVEVEGEPQPKQLSQSESSLGQSPKPKLTQPVSNQILKPRSAGLPSGNLPQSLNLVDFSSHYQLLQHQFIQQKKENIIIYVKICFQLNLKNGNIII